MATQAVCSNLPSTCTVGNDYCGSYRPMDIIIPTYEKEICRLGLLAKSVATYDVCGLINDIHLGWVTTTPVEEYEDALEKVRTAFQHKVYVHEFHKLWGRGIAKGWVDQQVFKLAVYEKVSTKWYLALDCKNIFINPITLGSLFAHSRVKLSQLKKMGYQKWYLSAAKALDVNLDPETYIQQTVTPFLFNTARVKSLYDYVNSSDILNLSRAGFQYSEFAMYETWGCTCNPNRGGEDGVWRELLRREAVKNPWKNHLTFHGYLTDNTIASLREVADTDAGYNSSILVGWHKSIPANGTLYLDFPTNTFLPVNSTFYANFVRVLGDIYTRARLLTTPAETCDFYTNCASGVVPCDDVEI